MYGRNRRLSERLLAQLRASECDSAEDCDGTCATHREPETTMPVDVFMATLTRETFGA